METVDRRTCAIEYNNTFRDRVMCFIPGNGNSLFGTVNLKSIKENCLLDTSIIEHMMLLQRELLSKLPVSSFCQYSKNDEEKIKEYGSSIFLYAFFQNFFFLFTWSLSK